jgi:hypothetical protein
MADERLRERERRAKGGGLEERQAWLIEVSRTRAPQALEAQALQERIAAAFVTVRAAVDAHFAGFRSETKAKPCPELALEPVLAALETALRDREGMGDVGYGAETLVAFWPREGPNDTWFQCGVFAFAARLGDAVTLAVDYGFAAKPTPGSVWGSGLVGWRESLRPENKATKLRQWVEAGSESGLWETLPLEKARLAVDLLRLPRGVALEAPAPIVKKGDVTWRGVVRGIQPRLTLQRPHGTDEYHRVGHALRLAGSVDGVEREFAVGIGDAALTEHGLRVGDTVSGVAKHVEDPARVPVDFYRVSKLAVEARGPAKAREGPPWHGPAPARRGAATPRALADEALRRDPCSACYWGCRVQVDAHDRPLRSVCFGPTSCPAYTSPDGAVASSVASKKATKTKTAKKKTAKKKTAKRKTAKKKTAKKKS